MGDQGGLVEHAGGAPVRYNQVIALTVFDGLDEHWLRLGEVDLDLLVGLAVPARDRVLGLAVARLGTVAARTAGATDLRLRLPRPARPLRNVVVSLLHGTTTPTTAADDALRTAAAQAIVPRIPT